MRLQNKIQLTVVLPVVLLAVASLAAYAYLSRLMTEQAFQKGLLTVQMVRTAVMSNVSSQGHSMNNDPIMEHFRSMPGLLEVRLIRGQAVSDEFGPRQGGPQAVDALEQDMLQTGSRSQAVKTIDGHEVLHFNGPLKAKNYAGNNCLQCHHVPIGTVLGGFSVQVDLTQELAEARTLPMYAFLIFGIAGILLSFALRRFAAPVSHTARQIADIMARGERGDFTNRLHDIPTGTHEVRQIVQSSNAFFDVLEEHIGSIAGEIEKITGHLPVDYRDNLIARARHGVDLMLFSNRLKRALEEDSNLEEAFARLSHVLRDDFGLTRFGIFESRTGHHGMLPLIRVGLPEGWCGESPEGCTHKYEACPPLVEGHVLDGHVVDVSKHPDDCCRTCGQRNSNPELRHFCIPIMDSDETRTVITILYGTEETKTMEDVLARVSYVMRVITPELRSKRLLRILKDIAIRDPLTGMYNRRFLEEITPGLIASVKRRNSSLGVLVCDIDLFKSINDTYGHETGDMVLRGIADIYRKEMRENDYVIRLGGEEILVLLMDASREMAVEIAERIRIRVSRRTFRVGNCTFSKTISIGVAVFPEDSDSLEDAMQCADQAVYQAKHQGRNRVIPYRIVNGEELPSPTEISS